jgi:hypothetical protein
LTQPSRPRTTLMNAVVTAGLIMGAAAVVFKIDDGTHSA